MRGLVEFDQVLVESGQIAPPSIGGSNNRCGSDGASS
jgi:hypothetical protein